MFRKLKQILLLAAMILGIIACPGSGADELSLEEAVKMAFRTTPTF